MKLTLKSSQSLYDIMNMNPYFYCKKVFHDLLNLLPKAEEGFIELNQCQVNNLWSEATYCTYPCNECSTRVSQTFPQFYLVFIFLFSLDHKLFLISFIPSIQAHEPFVTFRIPIRENGRKNQRHEWKDRRFCSKKIMLWFDFLPENKPQLPQKVSKDCNKLFGSRYRLNAAKCSCNSCFCEFK